MNNATAKTHGSAMRRDANIAYTRRHLLSAAVIPETCNCARANAHIYILLSDRQRGASTDRRNLSPRQNTNAKAIVQFNRESKYGRVAAAASQAVYPVSTGESKLPTLQQLDCQEDMLSLASSALTIAESIRMSAECARNNEKTG